LLTAAERGPSLPAELPTTFELTTGGSVIKTVLNGPAVIWKSPAE
jgi:hypothetical protein